jgi:acyl carrier protein
VTPREVEVREQIRRIVHVELALEWDGGDDEPLAGRLDSLGLLSLVVAVEDRFRVKLSDDDAATTRTLSDLARLVAARAPADGLEVRP